MNTKNINRILYGISSVLLILVVVFGIIQLTNKSVKGFGNSSKESITTDLTTSVESGTKYYGSLKNVVEDYTSEFIVTRHKPMGGSHYAYTEGVTDDLAGINGGEGNEANFFPGSQLVKISLYYDGDILRNDEIVLINSPNGVVRDPDVSQDGTKVIFSWKQNKNDDYHLYVYDLETDSYEQLTYGQGISDIEPKWLPNGKIVFSSTRAVQIVDCWKTPVSNLYICDNDGKNMIRLGYDQVHTTYPTVTEDGRVIFTRWDYNDRTQMYVHALFQMFQDGTNQTSVFGNNTNNPTTVMHTVGVPGASSKYLTIVSGHHVSQAGKLAWIDTSVARDGKDPIDYIFESAESNESVDTMGQSGPIYKFPIAINEEEIIYAKAPSWSGDGTEGKANNTKFSLYYTNTKTGETQKIVDGEGGKISASQIVPIRARKLFNRPSMVNYAKNTGVYYVANVYEGESMKGVELGDVAYLRVVALDYRAYAVGSLSAGQNASNYPDGYGTSDPSTPVGSANSTWDIKQVIGIVPVEDDGSVLFSCPSDVPVFFQLINSDGLLIQTMRSWSTLMPNETFSCVGCHDDKNKVPVTSSTTTMAMKKGVQLLEKDIWMTGEEYENYDPYTDYKGFSYANEIQPILDESCVACHTNVEEANRRLGSTGTNVDYGTAVTTNNWKYLVTTTSNTVNDWTSANFNPNWTSGTQPFGSDAGSSVSWGSSDDAVFYMTQQFTLTSSDLTNSKFYIQWRYDEDPQLYLNGVRIDSVAAGGNYISGIVTFELNSSQKTLLKEGVNTLTVRALNKTGGSYMSVSLTKKQNSSGGTTPTTKPVALTSEERVASRDKVNYYLSYLVLTGSFLRGNYYVGTPTNNITDWVGAMSDPTILAPYAHGSTQSGIIDMLMNDHAGLLSSGKITQEDIYRIAAWIDLGVPFRGSYDEASENWGSNEVAEAERRQNMRDYYDKIDQLTKQNLAGLLSNKKITVAYYDKNDNFISEITEKNLAILNIDQKIQPGDKVVVTLPKGVQYFWFNLNPKIKLSLIYCPTGEFTYTVPDYAENIYPALMVGNGNYVYTHPTITAFLPSEADLNTVYNVALNPYDAPYLSGDEMVTSNSVRTAEGVGLFTPSNVINGSKNNRGHGQAFNTSWGADKDAAGFDQSKVYLNINFGREVILDYFVLYIRADFPHDTYITGLTLEFSDGSTYEWTEITNSNQGQRFDLPESVTTESVRIKNIQIKDMNWYGITEFEAYGINA